MNKLRSSLAIIGLLFTGIGVAETQSMQFAMDVDRDTQTVTAQLVPDFDRQGAIVASATFSFLLPADTQTVPEIQEVPGVGRFETLSGEWSVQRITPTALASLDMDESVLAGQDLFLAVLHAGSLSADLRAGEPVDLFRFKLKGVCSKLGRLRSVNEVGLVRGLQRELSANVVNQVSVASGFDPARSLPIVTNYSKDLGCNKQARWPAG